MTARRLTGALDGAAAPTSSISAWTTAVSVNLATSQETTSASYPIPNNVRGALGNDPMTGGARGGILVGAAGATASWGGGSGRS